MPFPLLGAIPGVHYLAMVPWRKVGGFIVRHWKWIALGLLLLSWYMRGEKIEDLERQAEGWDNALITLKRALENNATDLNDCREINEANAADVAEVEAQVDEGEANVAALASQAETEREDARRDERTFRDRGDTTCRTLADPLPDWLLDGVRRPAGS